jgi:hypothetical protein
MPYDIHYEPDTTINTCICHSLSRKKGHVLHPHTLQYYRKKKQSRFDRRDGGCQRPRKSRGKGHSGGPGIHTIFGVQCHAYHEKNDRIEINEMTLILRCSTLSMENKVQRNSNMECQGSETTFNKIRQTKCVSCSD